MSFEQKTITKEEINEFPLISFAGEIILITNEKSCLRAIKELKQEKVLGFDTESRPSFKKGQQHPVSLLQLSTEKKAYLFRLNKVGLNREIISLLSDPEIVKTGVAILDDLRGLQALQDFTPEGFVEIVDLAKKYHIKNLGLRSLAGILLRKRVSKKAQLSNWAQARLNDVQMNYAATDAWVGLLLYQQFTKD